MPSSNTVTGTFDQPFADAGKAGVIKLENLTLGKNRKQQPVALNRDGEVVIFSKSGQELENLLLVMESEGLVFTNPLMEEILGFHLPEQLTTGISYI